MLILGKSLTLIWNLRPVQTVSIALFCELGPNSYYGHNSATRPGKTACMLTCTLIAAALIGQATPPATIDALETAHKALPSTDGVIEYRARGPFSELVVKFVNDHGCKTGESMRRAALMIDGVESEFRLQRVQYELALCAAALNDKAAKDLLPKAWDRLMVTMGQPMRLNAEGWFRPGQENYYRYEPTPTVISDVLLARRKGSATKDNAEVQKIVDEDQKVRQGDWSKFTEKEMLEVAHGDKERQKQILTIVKDGKLSTAQDFANASLVLQHSERFEGYQLAHELAVCSLVLGDRTLGRWLTAATYDRMLRSVGHSQRFGTQYGPLGHCYTDEYAINDTERAALGCPTLEKARKAKFN